MYLIQLVMKNKKTHANENTAKPCRRLPVFIAYFLFMKYFFGKNSDRFWNVVTPTLNDLFIHLSIWTSHTETITLGCRGDADPAKRLQKYVYKWNASFFIFIVPIASLWSWSSVCSQRVDRSHRDSAVVAVKKDKTCMQTCTKNCKIRKKNIISILEINFLLNSKFFGWFWWIVIFVHLQIKI